MVNPKTKGINMLGRSDGVLNVTHFISHDIYDILAESKRSLAEFVSDLQNYTLSWKR